MLFAIMDKKKIYVTKQGLKQLQEEFEELTKVRRPQVVERVAQARAMGDLAENSEYTAAREELSLITGRIEELSEILKGAVVIEEDHSSSGRRKIQLGSKVTLHVGGKKEVYTVVGEWEADPHEKRISHESPLGKGLMGRSVGEKIEVEAPAGKILYTVVHIE